MDCIFCKIAKKEIPVTPVVENERVLVFPDIHPQAEVHLLAIPKDHIAELMAVDDPDVWHDLRIAIQTAIREKGLDKKGYKLVANGGGLQDVHHLHMHILGPKGTIKGV